MDVSEVEENLFASSDAKLHKEMCSVLSVTVCKILGIFPDLEAARPRSKSGIQSLCSLHVALEKAKNLLQHCSDSSKLYLAITADSVLLKFEKAKNALEDSLRRVEDIVPQAIGCQISEIVNELEGTIFSLDPSEKQVGDEVISLLQQDRKINSKCNDNNELEIFHQAASRLGITSSRAALTERRALKKLIERARLEDDKRKESIVVYLLHLMRKYSKLFRSEFSDDNDSQGSGPCSPTVQGSFDESGWPVVNGQAAFDRQLSKLSSFNFKSSGMRSGQMAIPPEELRCPISLQLMYDPVIISSGQTYERVCIEKWFSDGHDTCPKTHQELPHLFLTPNYCVKGLIAGWCEHTGVATPNGPPDSLDLNYWRLALSECQSPDSRFMGSIRSCNLKEAKVVPMEESGTIEELDVSAQDCELGEFENYENLKAVLCEGEDMKRQCKVVEQIRILLKDDEHSRIYMGNNGFVEVLVHFLSCAVNEGNEKAQEIGSMALFNLAVNNNRNKEMILSAGVVSLLEEIILNSNSYESATALFLNLSCLEKAKPIIGSSQAVPCLVRILQTNSTAQCKLDALHTLYNVSAFSPNISNLLESGIVDGLQALLKSPTDQWAERTIAVLINLASNKSGRDEIISSPVVISGLASILDTGEPIEQEQAVSCLLVLCNGDENCCEMVLQEGVIPALVSISVNGTTRGKEKAQKLLMLFRQQRQRDTPSPIQSLQTEENQEMYEESSDDLPSSCPGPESKPLCKSNTRRMGRGWSSIWKSKNYSVH
ncbi:hypothetical protein GIB67_009308 [Kingdonia uniflora]|uniref:RING-type E3 ubiquitin transferase n=1 Tax=Kingdonia uniflora TaxID=39325 RepID=A0A7J7N2K7_9MAGN|nr:hypothetical protein GIB67_009308 [Kingdonia uniflora]